MIDFLFDLLDQGSTNFKLLAKTTLLPVSINNFVLEHSQTHLCVYYLFIYGYSHAMMAKLGNFNRDHMAHKVKNIY